MANNELVKRDERGRFISSGNPNGRASRKVETEYLELAKRKCGKSEWLAIVETAIEQAKEGDAKARQWLSDYLIGKPISRVMAVQERQDTLITVKYMRDNFTDKLNRLSEQENSNKSITVDWDD